MIARERLQEIVFSKQRKFSLETVMILAWTLVCREHWRPIEIDSFGVLGVLQDIFSHSNAIPYLDPKIKKKRWKEWIIFFQVVTYLADHYTTAAFPKHNLDSVTNFATATLHPSQRSFRPRYLNQRITTGTSDTFQLYHYSNPPHFLDPGRSIKAERFRTYSSTSQSSVLTIALQLRFPINQLWRLEPEVMTLKRTRENLIKNWTSFHMAIATIQHLLKISKMNFQSNSCLQRNMYLYFSIISTM